MAEIREQIGAIPVNLGKGGEIRVLLITTRGSGRWILPKGWPMPDKAPWRAAQIEALEEAGAEGLVSTDAFGCYHYEKKLGNGSTLPCRVQLYPMLVRKLKRRWKEGRQRKRRWFSPQEAAEAVNEAELKDLLLRLDAKKSGKAPALEALLKAS